MKKLLSFFKLTAMGGLLVLLPILFQRRQTKKKCHSARFLPLT